MSAPNQGRSTEKDSNTSVNDSVSDDDSGVENTALDAGNSLSDSSEGWWDCTLDLSASNTRQTSGLPVPVVAADRVFRGGITQFAADDDVWDLSDSLAELHDNERRRELVKSAHNPALPRVGSPPAWLTADRNNGFIRFHAPDLSSSSVIPCSLSLTAHQLSTKLGVSGNALHVQLSGGVIKRLEPQEYPLAKQNDFLQGLGFTDIARIQEEGTNEDLSHLLKFYSGTPVCEKARAHNQLEAVLNVGKGAMFTIKWKHRLCILSNTRLLVFKENKQHKKEEPLVIQLAGATVDLAAVKDHACCLQVSSPVSVDKVIYMSFTNQKEFQTWKDRCEKAASKLPSAADLSDCNLECLPENIFVNNHLRFLNLRRNAFRERRFENDITGAGWLTEFSRFTQLCSLNLADNDLGVFPSSVRSLVNLAELNLAGNQLTEIPPEIASLINLQVLHLQCNHLTSLPDQLTALRRLFSLALAFNRFSALPPVVAQMTNIRVSDLESVSVAGNHIDRLAPESLNELKYAKRIDMRFNELNVPLTDTMKFSVLERLTHLDVRDNLIADLDLRALRSLEYLSCARNKMTSLHVAGTALRTLLAGDNHLEHLEIHPKPETLVHFDVSRNRLDALPDWLSDCFFLQRINASYNVLTQLPQRLLADCKKLRSLRVGNNRLTSLPTEFETLFLDELHIQRNEIIRLPPNFLKKANRLKVLNATGNRLSSLPPVSDNRDLNRVRELYLSCNALNNEVMLIVSGLPRLRVLHLARNELTELYDREVKKMEAIRELNVSGNQLTTLPAALGSLPRLAVLRAHSNSLHSLPDLRGARSLQVLDVGHNQLLNVSVSNLLASQIKMLDMSLNSQLKVDPQEYKAVGSKKKICLVDVTGQNRPLPGTRPHAGEDASDSGHGDLWKAGFSESRGTQKRLCIGTLRNVQFGDGALFGMFDGKLNHELPNFIVDHVADVLQAEMRRHDLPAKYLKYTMLTMHRKLKAPGQQAGVSAALVHLRRQPGATSQYTLSVANVGDVEVVLCRRGEALVLTRKFVTTADRAEARRVHLSDGVITEDGKVNGKTPCTRLLGFSSLYPHVIPDPNILTTSLRNDDEFIVVSNSTLWSFVSPEEVVSEVSDVTNPVVAAKRLQDLAQGCGARGNLSILVVRLNPEPVSSRGSRLSKSGISDDVYEVQKTRDVARVKPVLAVSDATPTPTPVQPVLVRAANSAGSNTSTTTVVGSAYDLSQSRDDFVSTAISIEGSKWKRPGSASPATDFSSGAGEPSAHPLKPLPHQRFVKKGAAADWEGIMQKRLSAEVKDFEMKQATAAAVSSPTSAAPSSTTKSKGLTSPGTKFISPGGGGDVYLTAGKGGSIASRTGITPPWKSRGHIDLTPFAAPNPAYAAFHDDDETDGVLLQMETPGVRTSIANRIAMFEQVNATPSPTDSSGSLSNSSRTLNTTPNEPITTGNFKKSKTPAPRPMSQITPMSGKLSVVRQSLIDPSPVQGKYKMLAAPAVSPGHVEAPSSSRPRSEIVTQKGDFAEMHVTAENGETRVIDIARL